MSYVIYCACVGPSPTRSHTYSPPSCRHHPIYQGVQYIFLRPKYMTSKKHMYFIPPYQVALPPAPAAAGPAHHRLALLPASPPWHPPPPPSPPPPLDLLLQHHHHRRTLLRHLPRPPHPLGQSTRHCLRLHSHLLPPLPPGCNNHQNNPNSTCRCTLSPASPPSTSPLRTCVRLHRPRQDRQLCLDLHSLQYRRRRINNPQPCRETLQGFMSGVC